MDTSQLHTEKDLSQRLLAGEQAALGQVFRTYYKRLVFFAFKVVENRAVAEDVVQEAFINFWTSIQEKQFVPDNIEGYLFRIVRNLCLNHIQRQRMMDEKNGSIIEEFYQSVQQRMDEIAVKEELFYEVKKRFVYLTAAQVQVMQHLYVDSLSISEVAERLNTTEVNVRNHKSRALERLKSIMENDFPLFIVIFLHFF